MAGKQLAQRSAVAEIIVDENIFIFCSAISLGIGFPLE
jgi:hypothetical protein